MLWERLEEQLRIHAPGIANRLRPGVTEDQLLAAEKEIGQPLPPDIRDSYLRHDGCEQALSKTEIGFFVRYQWLPLDMVMQLWRQETIDFDPDHPYFYDSSDGQWDALPVRPWQTPPTAWLPIGKCIGEPATIYLDLLPGPAGAASQLVVRDVDSMSTSIFTSQFRDFLRDLIQGFESKGLVVAQSLYESADDWCYADGASLIPTGSKSVWG